MVEGVVGNLSDKDNTFLTTTTSEGAGLIKEKIFETIVAKETDKSAEVLSKVMAKADTATINSVINNITEKNTNQESKLSLKVMADFSEKNPEKLETLAQTNKDQVDKLTVAAVQKASTSNEDASLIAKVVAVASDEIANKVVEEVKAVTGKDKVLVFQPFGRTAENMGDFVIDGTSRSFHLNDVIRIVKELREDYAVIIMSEFPVVVEENSKIPIAVPQIPDVRVWSSIIEIADHFLGCDSLGQHMAKALGTSCTSVIGSTYPINISYPNSSDFDIIDLGEGKRKFSPIRLSMEDEIERFNDEVMELTDETFKQIITSVRKRLGKPRSYTGNYQPQETQSQEVCPTHGVVHSNKQPAQILGRTGK